MLPRDLRVRSRAEFTSVTRRGRKASCGSVVVYRQVGSHGSPSRAGIIVGRSVGGAVIRHRVSRRLRAILFEVLPGRTGELIVVRALPAAARTDFSDLRTDVLGGLAGCARARPRDIKALGQDTGTAARGLL